MVVFEILKQKHFLRVEIFSFLYILGHIVRSFPQNSRTQYTYLADELEVCSLLPVAPSGSNTSCKTHPMTKNAENDNFLVL